MMIPAGVGRQEGWAAKRLRMDVEKTMEFILEQQARFEAGMDELRQSHQATERLVRRLARWGAARLREHDKRAAMHEERIKAMEQQREEDRREFQAFLQRFDDFLRGQRGDGH